MKNNLSESVQLYKCNNCNIDTAFIGEQNKISCPYCYSSSKMELIKQEPLSPEFLIERINLLADRTHENLKMAFNSMTEDEKNIVCENGNDLEKEVLLILEKVKKFQNSVSEIKLK
jgi:hypothetical protein